MGLQVVYVNVNGFRAGLDMDSASFYVLTPDDSYAAFPPTKAEAIRIANDLAAKEAVIDGEFREV